MCTIACLGGGVVPPSPVTGLVPPCPVWGQSGAGVPSSPVRGRGGWVPLSCLGVGDAGYLLSCLGAGAGRVVPLSCPEDWVPLSCPGETGHGSGRGTIPPVLSGGGGAGSGGVPLSCLEVTEGTLLSCHGVPLPLVDRHTSVKS